MPPRIRPMSDHPKRSHFAFLGLCFILGLSAFGWLIGQAARGYKRLDEFVTVKGLSEREAPANLVIWPLTYGVSDENLGKVQEKMKSSREAVRKFLIAGGFDDSEISNAPPSIREVRFQPTKEDPVVRPPRYDATVTVLLRTKKVANVKTALENCDKLVEQDVLLTSGDRAQFLFTGLNEIKPSMIEEANRNARIAAEKFAGDSGMKIGRIRHAFQGPFEIEDVDNSSPDRKSVRVVTTVDFFFD
jgi:hypothetical protein